MLFERMVKWDVQYIIQMDSYKIKASIINRILILGYFCGDRVLQEGFGMVTQDIICIP